MEPSMYFEDYGGRYVPEMLQSTLRELAETYDTLTKDVSISNFTGHLVSLG